MTTCENFIEQSPFPMAATDGPEHLLCCVNAAFCAIYAKDARELLGRSIAEVVSKSIVASVLALLDHVHQSGEAGSFEGSDQADLLDRFARRSYTVWAIREPDSPVKRLLIHISNALAISPEANTLQAGDEMRDINEKLLISSVRQHELAGMIALAEQRLRNYSVILERQNAELERANVTLLELATTDGLTGLKNARAFQEGLREEFDRSLRYQTPLSLILLDVDHFKPFNDTYGHPEGDVVLVEVAHILQKCARTIDCVARYGGEEFAIILPQTDLKGAVNVAERIRATLNCTIWKKRSITASFGVAAMCGNFQQVTNMIAGADEALYRAKADGRDCIRQHSSDKLPEDVPAN